MGLLQRAFLYIKRKRGKTVTLFCILLIISTFMLTGLSIRRSANTAALNMRQSLGGSFGLTIDKSKSDHFKSLKGGKSGMVYTGAPIDDHAVSQVLQIPGIDDYNAFETGNALLKSADSRYLKLINISDHYKDDATLQHTITSEADTKTANSSYFKKGTFKLTEGRFLTDKDRDAAVISKELSMLNKLKLGDEILLTPSEEGGKAVRLKIIGIFEIAETQPDCGILPPPSLYQNRIFTDVKSGGGLYSNGISSYDRADFFVNDPAQIDSIIQKVKEDKSINWNCFTIDTNNTVYKKAAGPLVSMVSLLSSLLLVMVAASIAVLSLILTMWMKDRVHETGIFLSIGIRKSEIVLQHIVEIMAIAVIAFGVSFFTSGAAAQAVGNTMFQNSLRQKAGSVSANATDETSQTRNADKANITKLNVQVLPSDLALVYGIGTLVAVLSTGLSNISVLRLKPKEILTEGE